MYLNHAMLHLGIVAECYNGQVGIDRQIITDELLGCFIDPFPLTWKQKRIFKKYYLKIIFFIVRNSLSTLKLHSTDSLSHQHRAKKLSLQIALHFKELCESKATLSLFAVCHDSQFARK